jgi:hypothetical protein
MGMKFNFQMIELGFKEIGRSFQQGRASSNRIVHVSGSRGLSAEHVLWISYVNKHEVEAGSSLP